MPPRENVRAFAPESQAHSTSHNNATLPKDCRCKSGSGWPNFTSALSEAPDGASDYQLTVIGKNACLWPSMALLKFRQPCQKRPGSVSMPWIGISIGTALRSRRASNIQLTSLVPAETQHPACPRLLPVPVRHLSGHALIVCFVRGVWNSANLLSFSTQPRW